MALWWLHWEPHDDVGALQPEANSVKTEGTLESQLCQGNKTKSFQVLWLQAKSWKPHTPEGAQADGRQQQFRMLYYQNFDNSRIFRGLHNTWKAGTAISDYNIIQFSSLTSSSDNCNCVTATERKQCSISYPAAQVLLHNKVSHSTPPPNPQTP